MKLQNILVFTVVALLALNFSEGVAATTKRTSQTVAPKTAARGATKFKGRAAVAPAKPLPKGFSKMPPLLTRTPAAAAPAPVRRGGRKPAQTNLMYCQFISGTRMSSMGELIKREITQNCDANKPYSTAFSSGSEQPGLLVCCTK